MGVRAVKRNERLMTPHCQSGGNDQPRPGIVIVQEAFARPSHPCSERATRPQPQGNERSREAPNQAAI